MALKKTISNLRDVDIDDSLKIIGLQKRSSKRKILGASIGLGAGLLIGGGLVFFLTPYSGKELRQKIIKWADGAHKLMHIGLKGAHIFNKVALWIGSDSPEPQQEPQPEEVKSEPETPDKLLGGIL